MSYLTYTSVCFLRRGTRAESAGENACNCRGAGAVQVAMVQRRCRSGAVGAGARAGGAGELQRRCGGEVRILDK